MGSNKFHNKIIICILYISFIYAFSNTHTYHMPYYIYTVYEIHLHKYESD